MKVTALCNALLSEGARTASEAVLWLDACGCTVREIHIHTRRPLIRIDPPPMGVLLQNAALHKRIVQNGERREVYVALIRGARIEWETSQIFQRASEVAHAH